MAASMFQNSNSLPIALIGVRCGLSDCGVNRADANSLRLSLFPPSLS